MEACDSSGDIDMGALGTNTGALTLTGAATTGDVALKQNLISPSCVGILGL